MPAKSLKISLHTVSVQVIMNISSAETHPFRLNGLAHFHLDTQCTRIGGTCLNWDYYLCTAGWETGLCSGASNIRCCKPCDRNCQNTENSYNDKACTDKGGKCQHNSNKCSSGGYSGGLCGGPSARQCCGASGGGGGSGSCNLVTYSSSRIKGYNGLTVKVDKGFKSEMDKMDGFARQCSGLCLARFI